jgi:nucleoside-diphosphate-sugar epimerase
MPLVRRLACAGARVRVLVRSQAKAAALAELGAEPVLGDITDRDAAHRAVDGVTVVYHLAGKLLIPGVSAREYHRTHVEGTKVLLDCCRDESSVRRFVHCSTTGVLGVTGDRPADENAPFRPTNVYEATKADAELAVRDKWREGFPAVIVRPGLVYGPGDQHLLGFFRAVLNHRFRPIGRQPVWLHAIYIDDMTEALVRCGHYIAAVGECFHIAGQEPVTLAQLAAAIAIAGGTRLPNGHIPLPAARAVAAVGDWLPASLRRSAPLTSTRLDFLTHSRVYSVDKAERLLNFGAETDLSTGMNQTISWYRQNGYLPAAAESSAA